MVSIMDQKDRRTFLIRHLLEENPDGRNYTIPEDEEEQKRLLRGLFNVRLPADISSEFLTVQDEYLKKALEQKGITDIADLVPV